MRELFVLYDSLYNSVFQGQVVSLLTKRLDAGTCAHAYIISFEQRTVLKEELAKLVPDHRITIIVLKKIPFLGALSLKYASYQLRTILPTIAYDHATARGPLAGWIALRSIPKEKKILIQARGLAAEEYRYEHGTKWWHRFRAWQYEQIEKEVYGTSHPTQIEAVSEALKQYMVDTWDAPSQRISIAQQDIPRTFPSDQTNIWRTQIRKKLLISNDANVYVYAGSAHSWQCPEETIRFFKQKLHENQHTILLILSREHNLFKKLLLHQDIPKQNYRLLSVEHQRIYTYLAAADAGLLFRKKHIINWVSRPTKALEYQAVGLPIIHNDTVGMLCS